MRTPFLTVLVLAAGLLAGAGAGAQEPPPPPTPAPAPDYGAPITKDQARDVVSAALLEARKNGWRMAVAVVDPGGNLVHFERLDGTQNASVLLAQAKARTAALFRRPSKLFFDQFAAGNVGFMTFPDAARPIASEGGVPIVVDGKLIGAIGVSGGTGQQDGLAAAAGVGALH